MSSLIGLNLCRFARSALSYQRQYRAPGLLEHYVQTRFAGHAKWQNIRGTKMANDLAKSKLCTRYVNLVKRAVLSGGRQVDPKLNKQLGDVLSEAAKFNVPKATLDRAITRALNMKIMSTILEIQGPKGCTLLAKCETENIPALRRDVKKLLKKYDGALLGEDTVINMFGSKGFVRTSVKTADGQDIDQDFAEEAAILANAQEVHLEDLGNDKSSSVWVFTTDAESLEPCKGMLEKQGFVIASSDLDLVPYREIDFGPDVYEKILILQDALKETIGDQLLDIYHNVAQPS